MGISKEDWQAFKEAQENRHRYLVAEQQLGEQRIVDEINLTIKTEIEPIKERITSLETTRTYCRGVIKAVGIGVPAVGSLAWFMLKLGSILGNHTDKIK